MNHFLLAALLALLDLSLAPRLYHVERFSHYRHIDIRDLRAFNRQYRIHVGMSRDVFPNSQSITAIEKECDELWKAWDALEDSQNEMFSIWRRRVALGVLLKTIGPEAFMSGTMPPYVPLWRFVEVK